MIKDYWLYLLLLAGTTYLTRAVPLMLVREKIRNRFLKSFLYILPYTVLTTMTVPGIFYAAGNIPASATGFLAACFLAWKNKSVMSVAIAACVGVLAVQGILMVL